MTLNRCVEDHPTPIPTSSHWAKPQPQPQAAHQELVGMLETHTPAASLDSPAVQPREPGQGTETLPCSQQEELKIGEGELRKGIIP